VDEPRRTHEFLEILELVHRGTEDRNSAGKMVRLDIADILIRLRLGLHVVGDDIVQVAKLGVIAAVQLHGVVAIGRRMQTSGLGGVGVIEGDIGRRSGRLHGIHHRDRVGLDDGRVGADRFGSHDQSRRGETGLDFAIGVRLPWGRRWNRRWW